MEACANLNRVNRACNVHNTFSRLPGSARVMRYARQDVLHFPMRRDVCDQKDAGERADND